MFKVSRCFLFFLFALFSFSYAFSQDDNENAPCPKFEGKKTQKLFDKALDMLKDRNFNEAIKMFKEVIEVEPDVAEPYFYLGYINFKKADYNLKAAKKYFLKAVKACPDVDIYVNYYLGDIYSGAQQWDSAAMFLEKFVSEPQKVESDGDMNRANDLYKWAKYYNEVLNKPVPFDPHFVKGICTSNDEYFSIISPDGEIALYIRVVELPPSKGDLVKKPRYVEKFMYSECKSGTFDNGEEMPDPFNAGDNEGAASITIDNNELYLTICKDNNGYLNCDIYYARKNAEGEWVSLQKVENVNNADSWESQPSISSDGRTLFFVSDRPGGFGETDLYYSKRNSKGVWQPAQNIGAVINTKNKERSPFIHTDSKTLYFSSNSDDLKTVGGLDIFYSKQKEDGSWGKPKNLGYPINSESNDEGFFVSIDGKTGYFTTDRLKGPGGRDIFSFELYKEARPESMTIVKGDIKEENSKDPVSAKVEIKNLETKKVTEIPIDSISGQFAVAVSSTNDYTLTVKKQDYAYETHLITSEDTVSKMALKKVDIELKKIEVNKSYRLNDIYFQTNSFDLTEQSKSVLESFIEFLAENPRIKVSINGHTDNVGSDESNMTLSENRAKSVYEYLISKGILSSRLTYKGFGKTKPVATNDTEAGRARNRRTEFLITGK